MRNIPLSLQQHCREIAATLQERCRHTDSTLQQHCGNVAKRCRNVAVTLQQILQERCQCNIATQHWCNYAPIILFPPRAVLHGNVAATLHRHCAATMQHWKQVQGYCNQTATLPPRSVLYGWVSQFLKTAKHRSKNLRLLPFFSTGNEIPESFIYRTSAPTNR